MDISASDLRYFLEIAATGHFTRAAAKLGISQPALSHSVRRMEEALGTSLFIRSRSGAELTRAGKKLLAEGKQLLEHWEGITSRVKAEEEKVSGRYVLGCHPAVAIYSLPKFLPALQTKYPELEIRLAHGLSRHITEGVIARRVDFGLVINPTRHPDLVIRPLGKDAVTFWVSRKTPPSGSTLIFDPDLHQSQWLLRQLQRRKPAFERQIETSSLEVVRELVAAGCGVGILPTRVAQMDEALKRWSPDVPVFQDQICLVYRADAQRSLAGKAIVAAVAEAGI